MAFKHADRLDMAAPLARWMTGAGADMLHSDMIVIPVPLHWSRLVRRRFNQAALLAKHVSKRIGADLDVQALKRCHATPYLKDMTRSERHDLLRLHNAHLRVLRGCQAAAASKRRNLSGN